MTSFYYYYQNPSGLCFLVQIWGFNGIKKFKCESKNEMNSGPSSKKT